MRLPYTYTPDAGYCGADSFQFIVNDGICFSTATVSIEVIGVNRCPVANAQSVTTAEDTGKAIVLTGSDVEGSALTYAIVTGPSHGALSGTAPNVTYLARVRNPAGALDVEQEHRGTLHE